MDIIEIKTPKPEYDIHPLIKKRWSPLAFSEKEISVKQLNELFEAARWAASAYNEQPWRYVYALRGTEGFEKLWNCLLTGNQPWTKSAAVLMVVMSRTKFEQNNKLNSWAIHDVGMANAQLLLQASHRNIYGHMMAGFEPEKVNDLLQLDDDMKPVCMTALGYLGNVENLEESYKSRELSPRIRRSVQDFTQKL